MISDEAVEAAAKALWLGSDLARMHNAWEFLDEAVNIKPAFRKAARAALDAAAPHMLREAKAEGWDAGADAGLSWDENRETEFTTRNPYRSQA